LIHPFLNRSALTSRRQQGEAAGIPDPSNAKTSGGHFLYATFKPLWTRTLDLDAGLAIITK